MAAERTKQSNVVSVLLVSTSITKGPTDLDCIKQNRVKLGIISVLQKVSFRPLLLGQGHGIYKPPKQPPVLMFTCNTLDSSSVNPKGKTQEGGLSVT